MTYTLRPYGPEHYPRMVEIINQLVREPVSVDDLLREDRLRSKEDPYLRLGAFSADGDLMGYGMAQGGAGRPDVPWDRYLERVLTDPHWKDEWILLAADGDRWVALCQLVPQANGSLYNGFTAVEREYRGRNIALAVNRKLGYHPLPGAYLLAASI